MAKKEDIEKRFEQMLAEVLERQNAGNAESAPITIYDAEYVKEGSDMFLRGYIDKEGGVTIDDCEVVSRALSAMLDEEDIVGDPYILEVSSPGLGRTLKKDRHFEQSIGEEVELKLYKPKDGVKNGPKNYEGRLVAFDTGTVTVLTDGKTEETFNRSDLAYIRLKIDF